MFRVERTNENVLTLRHDPVVSGWEQWYLLASDVHWDNPYCERKLFERHLKQAAERNAGVFSIGDFYCAMQGKYDKRANKESIRPEHQKGNYLDALVDTAAEYLEPYKPYMVMFSDGNHETAIKKHLETDLLERLTRELEVEHMGYSGFVRFMFQGEKGNRSQKRMYFHHGSGGGGPVTKGVIGTNRRAASSHADIYATGHIHESTYVENVIVACNDAGTIGYTTQYHVQLPTYKDEYNLAGGYHNENQRPPKPLGAWWMRMFYDRSQAGSVGMEFTRAK